MSYLTLKRIIDVCFSLLAIIILAPLFILIIILIKIDTPGPVFFKQKRYGGHKEYFYILKFRTMKVNTPKDVPTHLMEDPNQWITRIGGLLRKTSLDELPQIVNILKGEMSLVGPRPALWNQYNLIEERDKYGANNIPVGLTGWAQVNGRDEINLKRKAELDGYYAKNLGLIIDLKCFVLTIISVFKKKGYREGKSTSDNN